MLSHSIWLLSYLLIITASFCPCDDSSGCDLLCCCDPDCSTTEKTLFDCQSSSTSTETVTEKCISSAVFSQISSRDGVIYTTNGTDYCFQMPSTATESISTVNFNSDDNSMVTSDTDQNTAFIVNSFNYSKSDNETSRLLAEDPIYYVSANYKRSLLLPASLSGTCVHDSVLYLRNTSTTCTRTITSGVCTTGQNTDATQYETDISLLVNQRESETDSVTVTTKCVDNSGSETPCSAPSENSGSCENVLSKMSLTITHNSMGLITADLEMTLKTITIGISAPLEVVVSFISNSQVYPNSPPRYERYRIGEEVKFQDTGSTISSFTPFSGATGCTPNTGPVSFGNTLIASCSKPASTTIESTTNCTTDFTVFSSLPTFISKFSNSATETEWLEIPWQVATISSCSSVPQTVILTVRHRHTGSRVHPELEVESVGVSVTSTNLVELENQGLLGGNVDFYLMVRWVSVNKGDGKEGNLLSRIASGLPQYSVPIQILLVIIGVFAVVSGAILYNELGHPEE
eukprot:sb/3463887/